MGETWSIAAVARLAGVSSRTLRHYDDVGLVRPAFVGANGYRYYERPQLQQLQEVLVLRELGLGLPAIQQVLSGAAGRGVVLREHQAALLRESGRLRRLAAVVGRTIDELNGGDPVTAEEMFEGFDHTQHEDEVVERWGRAAYDDGAARWAALGPEGQQRHHAEHEAIAAALGAAKARGAQPDDADVQELVRRHHAWVSVFWTPGREAYTGLGRMYAEDPRFTRTYDQHAAGTAELLCEAIAAYAEDNLS